MSRMILRLTLSVGQTAFASLFALAAVTPVLADRAIPAGSYNLWLVEHPVPAIPLYLARIAGVASYGRYQASATLAFNCRHDTAGVTVELALDPKSLDFDAAPYEGPDAKAHGPLVITSGNDPASRQHVSGRYGDGGAFDTGTPFIFSFSPSAVQMQSWTTAHGKMLRLEVPASAGGAPLAVQFRWPDNNEAFLRVVTPCLGKPAEG
jgi:hypothetical protein